MYRSEFVLATPAAYRAQQELKPVYRSIGLGWWMHVGWRIRRAQAAGGHG